MPYMKTGRGTNYRQYHLSFIEWIFYGSKGLFLGTVFAYTFFRSLTVFVIFSPLIIGYPLYYKQELKRQRLRNLNVEFKEGIQSVASALSSGYSVENAFREAAKIMEVLYGTKSTISIEFRFIVEQLEINRNIEEILKDFGNRSSLEDVQNFVESFAMAKRSGGDLVSMVNATVSKIGDKVRIDEEIKIMMAAKKLEQKIMNMVPVVILLYLNIASPGFLDVLYETMLGRIVMGVCFVIYFAVYWWSGKIIRIDI